jgi:hypothetical protein
MLETSQFNGQRTDQVMPRAAEEQAIHWLCFELTTYRQATIRRL